MSVEIRGPGIGRPRERAEASPPAPADEGAIACREPLSPEELLALPERLRLEALHLSSRAHRSALGQFFTPAPIARLMASMFGELPEEIRLLDPGAGVGSLTAAWVAEVAARPKRPRRIALTAFELDERLLPLLERVLEATAALARAAGIECTFELRGEDFLEAASHAVAPQLFGSSSLRFDAAILNPPYKKFHAASRPRKLLRAAGLETTNLYAAFLALSVDLLEPGGQLVSITPRSFCNGPYFLPFRSKLLASLDLRRIHLFESRDEAFRDDEVLQENLILHGVRGRDQSASLSITTSGGTKAGDLKSHEVPFEEVVSPADPQKFLHLISDDEGGRLAASQRRLPATLRDLGLEVSTGKVVDFRAREWLRAEPVPDSVPLLYPLHFEQAKVRWPRPGARKPNAIAREVEEAGLLVPSGTYVLVRRFSSKEERRRVVAALLEPDDVPGELVGIENHLNYFHARGASIPAKLARGLVAYLNSSAVDLHFRQFNGHTQVNATDLRALRYPSPRTLEALGEACGDRLESGPELDGVVRELVDDREGS